MQEIPFDSERKRMATIHENQISGGQSTKMGFDFFPVFTFVKGAPDIILDLCNSISENGRVSPLSAEKREEVLSVNQDMARQALRVLGSGSSSPGFGPDSIYL